MKIVVDLNRCRSYGQCVFAAPKVFRFHGEQSLEYDYDPDDELRVQVERAAAACPVQAISIGQGDEPKSGRYIIMSGKSVTTSLVPRPCPASASKGDFRNTGCTRRG
jgi:ferredoxin